MKPAGLLSASAAEPLFPFLTLLARTDCGCQPSSLNPPHCSQQRKDQNCALSLSQPLLPLLDMPSKADNQYPYCTVRQLRSTTGPTCWIRLKTSQASRVVPVQVKSCRSCVYDQKTYLSQGCVLQAMYYHTLASTQMYFSILTLLKEVSSEKATTIETRQLHLTQPRIQKKRTRRKGKKRCDFRS